MGFLLAQDSAQSLLSATLDLSKPVQNSFTASSSFFFNPCSFFIWIFPSRLGYSARFLSYCNTKAPFRSNLINGSQVGLQAEVDISFGLR